DLGHVRRLCMPRPVENLTASASRSPDRTRRPRPRERILEAAPQVLMRTGIVGFGLVEVAKEAGVSRQTIYNHFASRDDLLSELFAQEMRSIHLPIQQAIGSETPDPENIVRLLLAELEMGRNFPLFKDLLDPANAPRVAELVFNSPVIDAIRDEAWLPILERYRAAGLLRADLSLPETVRWITYQQFWFVTHPGTICADNEAAVAQVIRTFILPALMLEH
ncbi:TetR/AcrR family transcriptional regulator, partial [Nocardioides sp. GCM10030258]|uniref:TetR/AcrR family transcriptional regulator n=1 Tax=unclassified Nocardioides TaxID=2615069 RepID=UPI003609B388